MYFYQGPYLFIIITPVRFYPSELLHYRGFCKSFMALNPSFQPDHYWTVISALLPTFLLRYIIMHCPKAWAASVRRVTLWLLPFRQLATYCNSPDEFQWGGRRSSHNLFSVSSNNNFKGAPNHVLKVSYSLYTCTSIDEKLIS